MFTGIVEGTAAVVAIEISDAGGRLTVSAPDLLDDARDGESVAINGACLTVADTGRDGGVTFDLMPETLRRTDLGRLEPGGRVNVERSLRLGDRLGGHFVQGHVDGIAEVVSIVPEGDARLVRFRLLDRALARYIVDKGFIAVDGVSLTVVASLADGFTVSLVQTTLAVTILGDVRPGDLVNIEVDLFARYIVDRLPGVA